MATRRSRLAQLWQFPLLILSIGLFCYAAYLFIDPRAGFTLDQKVQIARVFLEQDRPKAALEQLNRILNTEKMPAETEGKVRLMMAEALELAQRELRLNIPANHLRIIEQTRLALGRGIKPDATIYKRMGDSYEALAKKVEALDCYRKAMALDVNKAIALQRKIIDLYIELDEHDAAIPAIDEYLKNKGLSNAERAWAMGEKAQIHADAGRFLESRSILNDALALEIDPVATGALNYRLGYSAFKLGDYSEAERFLRLSRDQLKPQHPLDADACYLLGRIFELKGDAPQAAAFYQVVLVSHPDSNVATLARLGRGVCRIVLKQDDAGLTDLHDLTSELSRKPSRAKYRDDAVAGLKRAGDLLSARANYEGALEVLSYEQQLHEQVPPSFFARLGAIYENRALQVEASLGDSSSADRIRKQQQVRDLRTKAGDAYVAYSRGMTIGDDKGYGEALWRGIELYDRASNVQCVISALELFVAERPEDALTPDALLRLGQAYQAAGLFDKAISTFQRNQLRYPQSLAASKSAVPLAQAYLARGPDSYGKAEAVLLSVVKNNPLLTPESEEFKQAVFDLGQLYYRTSRFEEAVGRLEEFVARYPQDPRMGQLLFLMGDSYRKSATLLDVRLAGERSADASGALPINLAEATAAKKDRLTKARGLYDRVIELYRGKSNLQEIDQLYLKLSHFYRADCLFDLGQYSDAIQLYDVAAFRYQDDPSALAAYVQIVNAYCALGKLDEARTANERAKWLLRRIPPDSFKDGSFSMPREYWEQWLKWTSDSGMW